MQNSPLGLWLSEEDQKAPLLILQIRKLSSKEDLALVIQKITEEKFIGEEPEPGGGQAGGQSPPAPKRDFNSQGPPVSDLPS